jgi:hypothetical protein
MTPALIFAAKVFHDAQPIGGVLSEATAGADEATAGAGEAAAEADDAAALDGSPPTATKPPTTASASDNRAKTRLDKDMTGFLPAGFQAH